MIQQMECMKRGEEQKKRDEKEDGGDKAVTDVLRSRY